MQNRFWSKWINRRKKHASVFKPEPHLEKDETLHRPNTSISNKGDLTDPSTKHTSSILQTNANLPQKVSISSRQQINSIIPECSFETTSENNDTIVDDVKNNTLGDEGISVTNVQIETYIPYSGNATEKASSQDIYRIEMLHLIHKHKSMVSKQQDEIAQLKELLKHERQLNSYLMSLRQTPPCTPQINHMAFENNLDKDLDLESASKESNTRRRAKFLPIEIELSPETQNRNDNYELDDNGYKQFKLANPYKPIINRNSSNDSYFTAYEENDIQLNSLDSNSSIITTSSPIFTSTFQLDTSEASQNTTPESDRLK